MIKIDLNRNSSFDKKHYVVAGIGIKVQPNSEPLKKS